MDQVVPFHDSARVVTTTRPPPFLIRYEPTAVQAVAEVQETLPRPLVAGPGLGLGTMVQVVPFQDSTRVFDAIPAPVSLPTAVQSLADTQETSLRLLMDLGLRLGTMDQVVPFQDSMSVLDGPFVV